jgi:hypothetical protein
LPDSPVFPKLLDAKLLKLGGVQQHHATGQRLKVNVFIVGIFGKSEPRHVGTLVVGEAAC